MMLRQILLSMLCASICAVAFAHQVTIRQAGSSSGNLLSRKDVQDDLGLSKEARDKIASAFKKAMADNDVDYQDQGEGRYTMRGMGSQRAMQEFEAAAMKLLTAPQKTRLEEIKLQLVGYGALDKPEIETALALTAAQRKQIADLKAKASSEQSNVVKDTGGRIDQTVIDKINSIQKKLRESLGKVLTADQQTKFKKLQGKTFKGRI